MSKPTKKTKQGEGKKTGRFVVRYVSVHSWRARQFNNKTLDRNTKDFVNKLAEGYEIVSAVPLTNGQGYSAVEYIAIKHEK